MNLSGISLCAMAGLVLASSPVIAADRDLRLPDHIEQGQLVIGHAPHGAKIEFAGRRLRIGADDVFVFGLDRDAPAHMQLHVRYANGKAQDHAFTVTKRDYPVERIQGLPPKTVNPDPRTLERIKRESARVAESRHRNDAREDFLGGFDLPVPGARISGVFGSQRIDNGVVMATHTALDLAVPTGTAIHAPAPGVVIFADPDLYLTGGTVLVDHGFGLSSSYSHLSRLNVKVGQKLARGELIGLSGATGRATGPHLHWGFNWFDVRLDPALLPKPTQ